MPIRGPGRVPCQGLDPVLPRPDHPPLGSSISWPSDRASNWAARCRALSDRRRNAWARAIAWREARSNARTSSFEKKGAPSVSASGQATSRIGHLSTRQTVGLTPEAPGPLARAPNAWPLGVRASSPGVTKAPSPQMRAVNSRAAPQGSDWTGGPSRRVGNSDRGHRRQEARIVIPGW